MQNPKRLRIPQQSHINSNLTTKKHKLNFDKNLKPKQKLHIIYPINFNKSFP
jgi:hypothetical protein